MAAAPKQRVIVDGFNLLHAAILRGKDRRLWWNRARQWEVLLLVARFLPHGPEFQGVLVSDLSVTLVFDGGRSDSERCNELPASNVPLDLHYAPNADDWIVDEAREFSQERLLIVSADRALLDRARQYGAKTMDPWRFAEICRTSDSERVES